MCDHAVRDVLTNHPGLKEKPTEFFIAEMNPLKHIKLYFIRKSLNKVAKISLSNIICSVDEIAQDWESIITEKCMKALFLPLQCDEKTNNSYHSQLLFIVDLLMIDSLCKRYYSLKHK
ncbi:hypothetical protein PR048_019728 [Dryococelus australis]|uniref:Uncharacterized protein n=1 Tax=Dryococelus australis TaxID=614101 RepID=A0ABQ9H4A3_9NEOP|nr:hypothetical protein PR048_019728 [Dryococelus australis]